MRTVWTPKTMADAMQSRSPPLTARPSPPQSRSATPSTAAAPAAQVLAGIRRPRSPAMRGTVRTVKVVVNAAWPAVVCATPTDWAEYPRSSQAPSSSPRRRSSGSASRASPRRMAGSMVAEAARNRSMFTEAGEWAPTAILLHSWLVPKRAAAP